MAEWLINKTNCEEAERFIRAKVQESGYSVDNLRCHMKWSAGKEAVVGYCRYPNKKHKFYTISARVKKDVGLPASLEYGVGTWQKNIDGARHWGFFYDKENADSYDDLMVWIVAHELWHFLCKTKQEKGNYQTKADVFGFKWMREFRRGERC